MKFDGRTQHYNSISLIENHRAWDYCRTFMMTSSMLYYANLPLSMPRMLRVRASNTNDNVPIKKMGMSDEECEAAIVAGNIPEAPPAPPKPAAPAGTPVVPSLVSSFIIFEPCSENVLQSVVAVAFLR